MLCTYLHQPNNMRTQPGFVLVISFRNGCSVHHPYLLIPDYLPSKRLECLLKDPDAYHSKMRSLRTVCFLSLAKSYEASGAAHCKCSVKICQLKLKVRPAHYASTWMSWRCACSRAHWYPQPMKVQMCFRRMRIKSDGNVKHEKDFLCRLVSL